ncbi:hypothetical protein BJY22_005419 [Kribbella shirazensis]|uniref:Uncharacterized protein n=1 Tax=Kribbella shirazensis TaxID=1105143 RepID=A0A7X6A2W4_9ACTN|nr:hypothetical protein [Kribbella shirazensis]
MVRHGTGGELEVRAILHRLGVRDADDIHTERARVRPVETDRRDVGHTRSLAGQAPTERLCPEPPQRRFVPSLEIDLHKLQPHTAHPISAQLDRISGKAFRTEST